MGKCFDLVGGVNGGYYQRDNEFRSEGFSGNGSNGKG
jgi:hypothetical protein